MAQVNNVTTDGILEVQEEIKIRHMNAIVRIQNWLSAINLGTIWWETQYEPKYDYIGQNLAFFLILKAEQQNALEVIFQKVDVDGNNQLDKAWLPVKLRLNMITNFLVTLERMRCTIGCTN